MNRLIARILAFFLFLSAAALLAMTSASAVTSSPLISAEQLASRLASSDPPLLLDASFPQLHAAGHVEGAVSVNLFAYAAGTRTLAQMSQLFQSWGLKPGRKVVLMDEGGTFMATRLYYDLYRYGFPIADVAVLDGGLARWRAIGGAVTQAQTGAPKPGDFQPSLKKDAEVSSDLNAIVSASGDPVHHALVDALEPDYYYGERKFFDRAGHLPNARLWPVEDFFNADKTFKSTAEIARMREHVGIRPEQEVHVYCGGGVAASVPFFAMKFLLNLPDVKLFAGSEAEWLRDERGLPFWTYESPALLRDAQWLNGWNNGMTRMYGVARLSVIDVRPAEAYMQGHLPFAQNIPAALFRQHMGDRASLAGLLAAAGVRAEHEVVIVGTGGLNPDVALAFALLERQGLKRVSVLMDSVEDWGFAGLALEKAARPVSAAPVAALAGLMTGDGGKASRPAQFARVYLAAGAKPPGSTPRDGTLIHLPYAELLDAQHRPKPAKALWQVLSKAGVPRYAEIVATGDDAGEAAMDYFVLKLMGYADVKLVLPDSKT